MIRDIQDLLLNEGRFVPQSTGAGEAVRLCRLSRPRRHSFETIFDFWSKAP